MGIIIPHANNPLEQEPLTVGNCLRIPVGCSLLVDWNSSWNSEATVPVQEAIQPILTAFRKHGSFGALYWNSGWWYHTIGRSFVRIFDISVRQVESISRLLKQCLSRFDLSFHHVFWGGVRCSGNLSFGTLQDSPSPSFSCYSGFIFPWHWQKSPSATYPAKGIFLTKALKTISIPLAYRTQSRQTSPGWYQDGFPPPLNTLVSHSFCGSINTWIDATVSNTASTKRNTASRSAVVKYSVRFWIPFFFSFRMTVLSDSNHYSPSPTQKTLSEINDCRLPPRR